MQVHSFVAVVTRYDSDSPTSNGKRCRYTFGLTITLELIITATDEAWNECMYDTDLSTQHSNIKRRENNSNISKQRNKMFFSRNNKTRCFKTNQSFAICERSVPDQEPSIFKTYRSVLLLENMQSALFLSRKPNNYVNIYRLVNIASRLKWYIH